MSGILLVVLPQGFVHWFLSRWLRIRWPRAREIEEKMLLSFRIFSVFLKLIFLSGLSSSTEDNLQRENGFLYIMFETVSWCL
jgi:hypothetical protein